VYKIILLTCAVLAGLFLAGAAGYDIGLHHGRSVVVRSGVAWSSGATAEVTSGTTTYNIPVGNSSDWYEDGVEHLGGVPSCLRSGHRETVRFATIGFYHDNALSSRVVWVSC
jgi:hypothetical protein